jgi:thiamine-phosphate pyrophosphorylase
MRESLQLPRLYPLTDCSTSGLSHTDQVKALIAGGATLIQLREKDLPSKDFYQQAVEVLGVAKEHRVKIIINDRVDLCSAVGADGVHLGQDDLPPEAARRLLGAEAIIGFSTHSVSQAEEAIRFPVDYLAIGPIFATSSKLDTAPVLGLEGLRAVRKVTGSIPLVAIGGITIENVRDVIAAGANSVATIASLLRNPGSIAQTTRDFLSILNS